ncbi:MAG: hypothetical protein KKG47_11705 [Proteobacteria bacterium]|nr:hypothetical protein [Pseudomonadota bacterium]MBU1739477.1 hypothetical protein [Pseudomonadota bacterium]
MTAIFPLTSLSGLLCELFEQVREGVLLCDAAGGVISANRSAGRQLGRGSFAATGLGDLFAEPCLSRARACVEESSDRTIDFLCPDRDGTHLFDCRLYRYGRSDVDSPFYLLSFSEALHSESHEAPEGGRCDSIGRLRQPLANLKAAAENLLTYPDMSTVMRSAFENIIAQESDSLTRTVDGLAGLCTESLTGNFIPVPCNAMVLVGRVLSLAGSPLKLAPMSPVDLQEVLVDGRWMQQLLLSLFEFLRENNIDLSALRFHPEATGRFIYLDMLWEGSPLKAAAIEEWRRLPLSRVAGSPSGADVLRGHGSDLWSQKSEKAGFALIRLPLPLASAERNTNG